MSRTKRKPYTGSKQFDKSCRNHGGCPACESKRTHKNKRRELPQEKAATVEMYTKDFVRHLIALSPEVKQYTRSEVEAIHNDYKARLDALEREL